MAINVTKQITAFQQIHAAIKHCRKGDWVCAITLAAAAEGQLPDCPAPYLFKQLRGRRNGLDLNIINNWCKHPTGPDEIPLEPIWPVIAVTRAISKFVAVYGKDSPEMHRFFQWARKNHYMAEPLAKQ